MEIDDCTKRDVIAEVFDRVRDYVNPDAPIESLCLPHAFLTIEALRARGHRAILQAGSASWRYLHPNLDDGVTATHFSYMWAPEDPRSIEAIREYRMPEVHVWVATTDPLELVDLTTGHQVAQARRLAGIAWTAEPPGPYLWGLPPRGMMYRPYERATMLALEVAVTLIGIRRTMALVS